MLWGCRAWCRGAQVPRWFRGEGTEVCRVSVEAIVVEVVQTSCKDERCRYVGAEVQRSRGQGVQGSRGSQVPRCPGAVVQSEMRRCRDAEMQRGRGAELQWCR